MTPYLPPIPAHQIRMPRRAASAARLAELTGQARRTTSAVVLGSGWAQAADALGTGAEVAARRPRRVPAADRARPRSRGPLGPGRRNYACSSSSAGPTCTRGTRWPPWCTACGPRSPRAAGSIVLTNAAGGIRAEFRPGQPVLISDHLNLTGRSPLTGPPPPDGYPSRFVDLTDLYSRRLRALARDGRPGPGRGRLRGAARARTTRPRPRSGCCGRSAPTWSACPPCWRRSPRATSAPRCWRSRWSPTWRRAWRRAGA